jgi:hypothetical protein
MVSQMRRWLQRNENSRHNFGQHGQPSEFWRSSKYDTQNLSWKELSEIDVDDLGMTFGAAINSLKKLWFSYKMSRKSGTGYRADIAWKINEVKSALGLPKSHFPELEGMEEESAEEAQLRAEEEQENQQEDDWNVDQVLGREENGQEDEW